MKTTLSTAALCSSAALAVLISSCQTTPPPPPTRIQRSLAALEKEGVKSYEEGRYDSAIKLFREAEEFARSTDNQLALANAFHNIGAVLMAMGDHDGAAESLLKASKMNEALNDDHARAVNLAGLAALELERGDASLAGQYNRQAEVLFEKTDGEIGKVMVLNNDGLLMLQGGKLREAAGAFDKALSAADSEKTLRLKAVILRNRGRSSEKSGDLSGALRFYREALEMNRDLEVFTGVARDLESIAGVQVKQGDKEGAAKTLQRALDVALLRIRWDPWTERLLEASVALIGELGRPDEAERLRERVKKEKELIKTEEERLKKLRTELPVGD